MLQGKKEPCTNLWHGYMKTKIQTYANVHKVSGHLQLTLYGHLKSTIPKVKKTQIQDKGVNLHD